MATKALRTLSFQRIEQYSSRRFRQAMRIYCAEFARDSRLSIARIRTLLQEGSYQLITVQQEERILGFALVWVCRKPAFVHLDYLAVEQAWKGEGIGTALYRWLMAHVRDFSAKAQLLTLEVEDDLIPFYRRSRSRVLRDVSYQFPGPLGPLPMHLMVHDALNRPTLDRATVRGVIRGLYCGLHRRGAKDPLLRSCLMRIPAQVVLT